MNSLAARGCLALRSLTVLLLLVVVGFVGAPPALAHEAPGRADHDHAAEAEARDLTEALKRASRGGGKRTASAQQALRAQAERRRVLLNKLAKDDPALVLELALDPAERAKLPAPIQPLTEERVRLDGELRVRHIDRDDGTSEYDVKLVGKGRETPLKLGRQVRGARPGDYVRVDGVALAGDQTVVSDQIVTTQGTTAAGPTGNQRTAIILASAPGAAAHPYADKDNLASTFFSSTNPLSARNYYLEASYGQTTILGASGEGTAADIFGPYTLFSATCDTSTILTQALAAADPQIDYNQYDRLVISWNYAPCGNGGVGTVRVQTVGSYDGATQRLSVSWNFNSAMGSTASNGRIGGVALHEYGHNLGVWHANTLECGTAPIGSGACSSTEYGDPADVMGSSGGYGHLNGVHKDILTWLSGGRAQVATSAGTYTINAYEDASANTKVLKVPRTRDGSGTVNGYYYLEYRRPSSSWNAFLTGRAKYGTGVLLHTSGATPLCTAYCGPDFSGDGGGGDSHLIDTRPNTASGSGDLDDAPIGADETYTDAAAGVTIRVVSTTTSSATVEITFSTPSLSVQSVVYPAGAGAVNGGGTYTAGQSVSLTAVANSGWSFVRWRENRSTASYPNPYTFTITADRMLEAVFAAGTSPANDSFSAATNVNSLPATFTANTTAATTEPNEATSFTCGSATVPVGNTVWYSYTPNGSGTVTISTASSDFDTVIRVYRGTSLTELNPVTCNDDVDGGTQSRVSFSVEAGTAYRIQVGGWDGDSGSLQVAFSGTIAPPCQPKPQLGSFESVRDGHGVIRVTLSARTTPEAPVNYLRTIRFIETTNAQVDTGNGQRRSATFELTLPPNTTTATFKIYRLDHTRDVKVGFTVTDSCHSLTTSVSGSPSAF